MIQYGFPRKEGWFAPLVFNKSLGIVVVPTQRIGVILMYFREINAIGFVRCQDYPFAI